MKPISLLVLGAGHLGKIHTRLACANPERFRVLGTVDPIESSRTAIANEFQIPAYASLEEIAEPIEAAIIAAPTIHHRATALELLARGAHLFVEKPITLSSHEGRELTAAAEQARRVLQVGHVERFNPAWQAAIPRIDRPQWCDAVRTGPYTFRSTDVGVVLDLMIHDLDLILSLARSDVTHVEAIGGAVFGPHEDWAHVRLEFADSSIATLFASRVHPVVERRMQIVDRSGFHFIDFQAKTAKHVEPCDELTSGSINVHALTSAEKEAVKAKLFQEWLVASESQVSDANAILEEQAAFAASIHGRAPVSCDGKAGTAAVAVAELILAELQGSPRAVTVPFPPRFAGETQRRAG